MRTRGSVAGPLILISVGVIFLAHTFRPDFPIIDFIAKYWPYLLIAWGALQLLEISVRAARGGPLPVNGVSGGGWFLVVLVCFAGLGVHEFHRPVNWWQRAGFERGVEVFGNEHDYTVGAVDKEVGKAPRIVIESFRGNAHIVGRQGTRLQVSGHKTVRTLEMKDADRTNQQTPVEVLVENGTVTIRCNQNKADSRTRVTTDLELTVPADASIEATGRAGDFEVTSVAGNLDLSSENAGMRLQDIGGNVKIDTRHGDALRCSNIRGTVDLRGHGTDIDLEKIAGQVTITGDYTGTIELREIAKPVRLESMQTELNVQQLPGEIKLERGSLTAKNVIGPVQLNTRATDVDLNGFTAGLDLTVEKGDVDLKPDQVPLSRMVVRTRSGNIDLALPEKSKFALTASTDHGEIENEFGGTLRGWTEGRGAKLEGGVSGGPDLSLSTDRGTITVRKSTAADVERRPLVPIPPRPPSVDKMPVGKEVEL